MLSVRKALDYLTRERLREICREQDLIVSGNKTDIIDRLARACGRDFTTMLGWLYVDDLLDLAGSHFDERTIREFVLATAKRKSRRDGGERSSNPTRFYSTGSIGNVPRLDVETIKADAGHAVSTTVVSAYYVPSMLRKLLVDCGDVRFVTNGLGGRRLEEQRRELGKLADQLARQNQSASVRLAFSSGIFHTKLYVFESHSSAVAWVGSANATGAALDGHNEEVLVRLDPAPQSILKYAHSVWAAGSDLDDCRPDIDSLAAFFRTGDIYYRPYAYLRVTANPFRPLLDQLPRNERAKLSPFTSPYAEAEAGVGAFNVRRVYEDTAGRTMDPVSKRQARIRPYAVETCYGYWVPEAFMDQVDELIKRASVEKEQFLAGFLGWLEGEGYRRTLSAFQGYLVDAKRTFVEFEVDWESHAPQYRHVFDSSDCIEKCVEDLIGQLRHPIDCVKHSHPFVTARLPEIWDDVVARTHFERTFFESLEAQSSKRSHKWVSARWILHNIGCWGEATAAEIRERLKARLADPDWYASVKDGRQP